MKKFNFSKLLLAGMLVASLVMFSGCKPEAEEDSYDFEGTWRASYGDTYVINSDVIVNYAPSDDNPCYTLNIVDIEEIENSKKPAFYVYCQSPETFPMYWEGAEVGSWYTEDNYTAFYIEVLSEKTIKIAGASHETTYEKESEDLEYVKTNFKLNKGYFSNQPEYSKIQ